MPSSNLQKIHSKLILQLNSLGSVFDSTSICTVAENIILIKFIVEFNNIFWRLWLKNYYSFECNPNIFYFHICVTKLSTDQVFVCDFNSISSSYSEFYSLFWIPKKMSFKPHGIYSKGKNYTSVLQNQDFTDNNS